MYKVELERDREDVGYTDAGNRRGKRHVRHRSLNP